MAAPRGRSAAPAAPCPPWGRTKSKCGKDGGGSVTGHLLPPHGPNRRPTRHLPSGATAAPAGRREVEPCDAANTCGTMGRWAQINRRPTPTHLHPVIRSPIGVARRLLLAGTYSFSVSRSAPPPRRRARHRCRVPLPWEAPTTQRSPPLPQTRGTAARSSGTLRGVCVPPTHCPRGWRATQTRSATRPAAPRGTPPPTSTPPC